MITIDPGKCIGCFKCVPACPFNVLRIADSKPEVREDRRCIKCLHCAGSCPQNAIELDGLSGILPQEMPKLPENFSELLEGHLMTRRSYRRFKQERVPREVIEHALRISAWAPSAKNQHPTKWIVLEDDTIIAAVMDHILEYVKETGASPEIVDIYEQGQNVVMGNARTLILAYCRTTAINPTVDTALALYSAELTLQAQGVGTCWAGYLTRLCNQMPAIRNILNLPENCQLYGGMMVGYPQEEKYIHIPNRHQPMDIRWL